jgi:hypothetical protein
VNIGDVNVQFPDTLLWKRRSMLLDSQGYLIVSPALTAHGNDRDKANAGAVRRYHLSAFRTPTIPDVEMQELPNSVVLDFVEGGGLQVACEDRGGQGRVLNSKFPVLPSYINKALTSSSSSSRCTSHLGSIRPITPLRTQFPFISGQYIYNTQASTTSLVLYSAAHLWKPLFTPFTKHGGRVIAFQEGEKPRYQIVRSCHLFEYCVTTHFSVHRILVF